MARDFTNRFKKPEGELELGHGNIAGLIAQTYLDFLFIFAPWVVIGAYHEKVCLRLGKTERQVWVERSRISLF